MSHYDGKKDARMPFTLTGATVRELRLALGVTQADLARQLGYTRFAICKWERYADRSIPRAQYEPVLLALRRMSQTREDARALAHGLRATVNR